MSDSKVTPAKPDLSKTQCKAPNSHFGNILIVLKKKSAVEKNFGMRSKCEESLFEYPAAETETDFDAQVSVPRNAVTDMSSILARQEPAIKHFRIDEAPTEEKKQISSDMVTSNACTRSMNKVREDILSMAEHHPQSSLPEINKLDTLEEKHILTVTDPIVCTRRKCHIVFTDVTHDKEANTVQLSMTPDGQQTPFNTSGSIGEKNQISSDGVNEGQLKKSNTPKSSVHKLVQNTLRDSCKNLFTLPTNQVSRGAQNQVTKLLMTEHATDGTQNGRLVSTQGVKRKRSNSPVRERSLASLLGSSKQWPNSPSRTGTISRAEQNIEILNNRLTCMETLVADAVPTKKRSKRSTFINSTVQNMYNHQNIAGTSMGPPLALEWKTMSSVDSITAGSRSSDEKNTLSYIEHSDVTHEKEAKTLQEFEDGTIREVDSIQEGYLRGQSIDTPLAPVISSDIIANRSSQTPDISVVKLLKMVNTVLHGTKSNEDNIDNPTDPAETITFTSCSQSSLCGIPKPGAHQTVEGNLVETEKYGVGDFDAQVRMPTNTIRDRSSISACYLLDLNAPPKIITDALLRRRTSRVPHDLWTYTMS